MSDAASDERAHVVMYLRGREAYYKQREKDEMATDVERAVFYARVSVILGREADDIQAGEHRPAPNGGVAK